MDNSQQNRIGQTPPFGPPPKQGLYDPVFEHDSCGVGFVAHIKGKRSHQILIDAARRKNAQKRVILDVPGRTELPIEDAITIADTLEKLERDNPRQAQIIRCRFLLGMTADETAAALRLGKRTVEREWQDAKAFFNKQICPDKE